LHLLIRVSLFGGLNVEGGDDASRLLVHGKLSLLVSYLLVAPRHGFAGRERLASLFWPDQADDRARSSLRSALRTIRDVLGDVVLTRGEDVGLDTSAFECDATEFERALRAEELAHALELYRGPFLDGVEASTVGLQHWLDEERRRFGLLAADGAWELAVRFESGSRNLTSAGRWARRAAKLAGADERRLRRVMELLARTGDVAGALQVFEEFRRFIRSELDAEPSMESIALARSLREEVRID
jgi:DNA-binding SARP family transcriptional activator